MTIRAVALTTQCPCGIAIHNEAAREAGVTDAQLAEADLVAVPCERVPP